jgi:hypothetical protein
MAAVLAAVTAYAAENIVENGDFETGDSLPWGFTNMVLSAEGARNGNYGAYFYEVISGDSRGGLNASTFDAEQAVWGELEQTFTREIRADDVTHVGMWVYYLPDTEGNPWYLVVSLGLNELSLSSERGELVKGWNYVSFPVRSITKPFTGIYVKRSLRTG